MTPFYSDDWLTLYGGDCREVLASLPADSVDCVVTSPPYWGLRDYGSEGQLGLERTPEEYVANMVAVFREVRRVLKLSGTCWLNLGDSYAGSGRGGNPEGSKWKGYVGNADRERAAMPHLQSKQVEAGAIGRNWVAAPPGLKGKDLVGIPWRVAFALQADGWYLRSDIIWSKPNPMPESVTDRPTKSHEYLFLLTKSARYYFDADAVRESLQGPPHAPGNKAADAWQEIRGASVSKGMSGHLAEPDRTWGNPAGRNIRSVWNIATRPYPGAHFAVFPPELPERCIKAGSSQKGVCPECGAPWERVAERMAMVVKPSGRRDALGGQDTYAGRTAASGTMVSPPSSITTGWQAACWHQPTRDELAEEGLAVDMAGEPLPLYEPVPAVILDPFGGSGTVGMVANRLSRRAILIDLNPEYLKQQMKRNAQTPLGLDAA